MMCIAGETQANLLLENATVALQPGPSVQPSVLVDWQAQKHSSTSTQLGTYLEALVNS
jgi:hypothetical protein